VVDWKSRRLQSAPGLCEREKSVRLPSEKYVGLPVQEEPRESDQAWWFFLGESEMLRCPKIPLKPQ